jgi:hypothetical protein
MADKRLTVHAGNHDRHECPVWAAVDGLDTRASYIVHDEEAGVDLPAQIVPHESGAHLVWIVSGLAAGAARTYTVQEVSAQGGVTVTDGEHGVDVHFYGEHFTTYRYAAPVVKPYLYPVIGPTGDGMTRNYPMIPNITGEKHDHPHHKSIYVSHGEVNGADVWSEVEGHGYQRHVEFLPGFGDSGGHASGPVLGAIRSRNDWVGADEQKVVEDERRYTFYPLSSGARLIDVEVTFHATAGPVCFGDTKEGGIISLRVATSMDASDDGRMENAIGGIGEAECWGKRAQWLDYTGPVNGKTLGFAVYDHPSSFRYPTYWHARNYGLFTANPFGLHDFYADPAVDGSHTMPAGAKLRFKYRIYVHEGDTATAQVANRYHDFITPPEITEAE